MSALIHLLRQKPVIAACRDRADLSAALQSSATMVFLLTSAAHELADAVAAIQDHDKLAFVHVDMTTGFARDQAGVRLLASVVRPDGIISTRPNIVSEGRQLGLYTVQRLFLLDSQSVQTGLALAREAKPDLVEVLPGMMPDVIGGLVGRLRVPLVAGGLIKTEAHARAALGAGAIAVSTTAHALWNAPGMAVPAAARR